MNGRVVEYQEIPDEGIHRNYSYTQIVPTGESC